MHWPQYVVIGFAVLNIGFHLLKDGEPRTGKFSLDSAIAGTMVGQWLLWMGGFYG